MEKRLSFLLDKGKKVIAGVAIAALPFMPMKKAEAQTPIPQQPVGSNFFVSGEVEGGITGYLKVVWTMDSGFSGSSTDYGFHTSLENLFVGDQGTLLSYTPGWIPTITSEGCGIPETPETCNKSYYFDTDGGYISPDPLNRLEAVIVIPGLYGEGSLDYTRNTSVSNAFNNASNGQLPVTELMATGTIVPEPVSSALFLTGGALLGYRRHKQKKAKR